MDITKKVKKVIDSDREGDVILESEATANLQEANITKITGVPHPANKIMIVVASAKKEYFDALRHVPGASMRLLAFLKTLALMYFANGEFYESQAILLKDPSMILDLGYKYYVPRKLKGKLPLEVRNTEVDGELFAIPKGHEGTRYYSMECCASGTDTVLRTDMIGTANGEIIRGFTSGDLLMFRSQPVFLDGTKGEFTPYFTIRVR